MDWSDREAFLAQLWPKHRAGVKLWEWTFAMPFNEFRRRVKAIAQRNLAAVEGATVTEDWGAIPDGAAVLPVDDDDWFSPRVGEAVGPALADPGTVGCHWAADWLQVPTGPGYALHMVRLRLRPWITPGYLCATNNYALVKAPGVLWLARRHMYAGECFTGLGPELVPGLDERLSLMNRTLASRTMIRHRRRIDGAIGRRELLLKRRACGLLYRRVRSRPEWARPYIREMAALMEELEVRPSVSTRIPDDLARV